jgi:hypothetical protein
MANVAAFAVSEIDLVGYRCAMEGWRAPCGH